MKLEELSRLLLAADPAAVLVPPAALARVIKRVTGAPWGVRRVQHSRCFLVDRHTLFKEVEQDELDLPPDHQLPTTVLLLERPSAERLTCTLSRTQRTAPSGRTTRYSCCPPWPSRSAATAFSHTGRSAGWTMARQVCRPPLSASGRWPVMRATGGERKR